MIFFLNDYNQDRLYHLISKEIWQKKSLAKGISQSVK